MRQLIWLMGLVGLLASLAGISQPAAAQGGGQPVISLENAAEVVGLRQWAVHNWGTYALVWLPTVAGGSPDGMTLAAGAYQSGVSLWDARTGTLLRRMDSTESATINSLAWSPDGTQLLGGLYEGAAVWDAASGEVLASLGTDEQIVASVAWSPDGARLAAGTTDGTVFVWEAAELGRSPQVLAAHGWVAAGVTFSPDGNRLASAGSDNLVKVWDVASGEVVHTLPAPTGVQSVAWSPDGRQIAAGCWDGTVLVWAAEDGQLLFRLYGHAPGQMGGMVGVIGVAFSPDGRILASVAGDGSLRLWDAAAGTVIVALGGQSEGLDRGLHSLAWSPDGSLLATGAETGSVWLWGVPVLQPGWIAQVHVQGEDRLNLRTEPRIDTNLLARLEDGVRVTILDGPVEGEGYAWWQVQTADGVVGWAVEIADGLRTLQPVTLPTTYPPPDPASGAEVSFPTPTLAPLPTLTPLPLPTLTEQPQPTPTGAGG